METLDCLRCRNSMVRVQCARNQGEQAVFRCSHWRSVSRLPVPLLGIDSDNDGAFINQHLKAVLRSGEDHLTRSRPYKKNDQDTWRARTGLWCASNVGYARYAGDPCPPDPQRAVQDLRLYVNFFQPVMKLKEEDPC